MKNLRCFSGPLTRTLWVLAALASCGGAYAQSSVTAYGRVDVGVDAPTSGGVSAPRVFSGGNSGSALGFRGSEDLSAGLSAIFKLEMGFTPNNGVLGQGGRAFGREASVGLSDRTFGTVQMGRIATPYYAVYSNMDAFYWEGSGGLLSLGRNINATTQTEVLPLGVNGRQDNAINYITPQWGGFEGRVQGSLGQGSTTVGGGYGASGHYVGGGFDVIAAYQRQNGVGGGNVTALALGGSYNAGFAKIFAGVTDEKNSCATCTGALARSPGATTSQYLLANVGVRVPFGLFTAVAQYTRVNDKSTYTAPTGNRDVNWMSIGGDYDLSKLTRVYFGYSRIGNRNGSQYLLGTGTAPPAVAQVASLSSPSSNVYIGIRHNF